MESKKAVSLVDVIRLIWGKKVFVFKVCLMFAVVGVIIAYTTPEEWSSRIELMPELRDGQSAVGNGSLGRLAGLAGFDIGGNATASLSPILYPEITNSFVFKLKLLEQKFYFSSLSDSLSLRQYFEDHSKSSLLNKAMGLPRNALAGIFRLIKGEKKETSALDVTNEDLLFYTLEDKSLFEEIQRRLSVSIDESNGIVKISSVFQDPVVSAMIVNYTRDYLTEYVSRYNTEKETRTLDFLTTQLTKTKKEYEEKQLTYANYQDKNINLMTQESRSKSGQLQREVDLAFNLYSSLALQVQESTIAVEENKTVFTVLKPATVPVSRSKPKRGIILILSVMLGTLLSAAYLFYKNYF